MVVITQSCDSIRLDTHSKSDTWGFSHCCQLRLKPLFLCGSNQTGGFKMRRGPPRTSSWLAGGVNERPELNCTMLALKQTLYCGAVIRTAVHKTKSFNSCCQYSVSVSFGEIRCGDIQKRRYVNIQVGLWKEMTKNILGKCVFYIIFIFHFPFSNMAVRVYYL